MRLKLLNFFLVCDLLTDLVNKKQLRLNRFHIASDNSENKPIFAYSFI